jgi:ubiquinol-cytochrome c reductase cytochrome c subunit
MRRTTVRTITRFAAAVALLAAPAYAQTGDAAKGKAAFLKAGCYGCHGTMGQGGPGGRLAPKPVPMAAFTSFVRNGKMGNPRANRHWAGMPPYSARFLSDAELADIYAYLVSIPEPPDPTRVPLLSER